MRAELRTPVVHTGPGVPGVIEIEVFNTSDVIAGITAHVRGLDHSWVRSEPEQLALFPESSGLLLLHLDLPPEMPAGRHDLVVELLSSTDPTDTALVEVELVVSPVDLTVVTLEPASAVGRRRGELGVVVDNRGNTPVEVTLSASDPERALRCTLDPPLLLARPAERVVATLRLEGRPPIIGAELTRPITVVARTETGEQQAVGSFTQRPLISRGVATAVALGAIVALWALVAVFGIGAALDAEPLTKAAPASFFAPGSPEALGGASGTKGLDPAVVGQTLEGQALSAIDGSGVERISVEVVRRTRTGPRIVAAAATDEDGEFSIDALIPGQYVLHFTAPGFEDVWYPDATSQDTAIPVKVGPETAPVTVEVVGLPGTLQGRVDAGGDEVAATVSLVPIVGGERGTPVDMATTAPDGSFVVTGLPTPATYEILFTAPGFQPTSRTEALRGGETLMLDAIRLTAGDGVIAGTVTDGIAALGGVTVTARAAGQEAAVTVTPTSGAVGTYRFEGLRTPGTYILTFTKDGYGTETVAVGLGPGEQRTDLVTALAGGTGTITGRVTDASGAGLGEVTVTVRGGEVVSNTATLTSGQIGAWRVTGLPSPGEYTVTFEKPGYVSQTVAVTLGPGGSASGVDVRLQRHVGVVTGVVRAAGGGGLSGVTVRITDGQTERVTTSVNSPTTGSYTFDELPPGSYSVTFERTGYQSQTVLVQLGAGQRRTLDVTLVQVP